MRLTPKDEHKIKLLKERFGFNQTSDLIRYLITDKIEELIREKRKLQPPQRPQK
jgi:hypothetical protein